MFRRTIKGMLNRAGLHVARTNSYGLLADNLLGRRSFLERGDFGFFPHETEFYNYFVRHRESISLAHSHSQLGQDLWIVYLLDAHGRRANNNPTGFFVEFGGFDGKTFSNTYLLEKEFKWNGIIAEPIPDQFEACRRNRSCALDARCVWKESGATLTFNVVEGANELGTISNFESADLHKAFRESHRSEIQVKTVSLNDLLSEHRTPETIDYVSIDTEGSEFDILAPFPFESFRIKALSVEHNFTAHRQSIRSLLERKGFFRLLRSVDYFDDIYLHQDWFDRSRLGGVG